MINQPNCSKRECRHFLGVKSDDEGELNERPVCRAFPNGIPTRIAYGPILHTAPVDGDHGVQYKKDDGAE